MRITNNMVDIMHSMYVHASECRTKRDLRGVYIMAKRKLIILDKTDNLTLEEYHSVVDFIYHVYKRELYRLKHE